MSIKTTAIRSTLTILWMSAFASIGICVPSPSVGKQVAGKTSLRSGPPRLQMEHKSVLLCVTWSPDGKYVAAGEKDGNIRITEAATGKEFQNLATKKPVTVLAFAPDGKTIAVCHDGHSVGIWDIATGKEAKASFGLGIVGSNVPVERIAFTPDGKTIMGIGHGSRYVWSEVRGNGVTVQRMNIRGFTGLAPDASVGGWCDTNGLCRAFEIQDGQGARSMQVGAASAIAFGPDAKLLAVASTDLQVKLWDIPKAKEIAKLAGLDKPATNLTFAADGKTLAAACAEDSMICAWDLTKNSVRCLINHSRGIVGSIALSPDGQMLATTVKDSKTLLLWKLAPREPDPKGPPLELQAAELVKLWTELVSTDYETTDKAWRRLNSASDKAIPFLRQQIRAIAVPAADMKAIAKLLADLDSREFVVRENASKELAAAGELAVLPLQQLLEKSASVEAKERARLLLQKIGEPPLTPDQQRVMQAIDLLEQQHSAEAIAFLKEIQRDTLIATIHREAQNALQRLAQPAK